MTMTRKEVQDHATKVHRECADHAKAMLSPEDYELYGQTMSPFLITILLLNRAGKDGVWNEALATLNRITAIAEANRNVMLED